MSESGARGAAVVRRLEAVPLRTRLLLILGVLLGTALILTSGVSAYLLREDLMNRVDSELRSVLEPVSNQALTDLRYGSEVLPTSYAVVIQQNGQTYVRPPTGSASEPKMPTLSASDEVVTQNQPFTVGSIDGGSKWRFIAAPVPRYKAVIAIGVPLATVTHTVNQLLLTTGLIGTMVLLLSLLLGHFAVRRAFRPLSRIEDTAAAIAGGDLAQRIPIRHAGDEVTSLSRSLNAMLSRIESSFEMRQASEERMRQFIADASHELRTPLATVRGYAELYEQGALPDQAAVGSAMGRIEAEATRMGALVDGLLVLARLDEEPETTFGPVDLTVLAADAVADARARAPERRISLLGLDGPLGPVMVRGSESQLRQVVTNLVANALRHTPDGTPVEIAVGHDSQGAALEVRDHGHGVPQEISTRVFERFYRTDPSRDRASGGAGLGLAIVAAIIAAHDGRVGIAPTHGGGATFVVQLAALATTPEPDED